MLTLNQQLYLAQGALWTVVLAACGFIGGGLLGFGVALARTSRRRALRALGAGYVQAVQGVPLPVMMFLSYFGLALGGRDIPALLAASVSMAIFSAAYLGEIWRGAIEAVPAGQREAADALALPWRSKLADIVLPQALRLAIPPTVGFMVQIIKNTSYAVVIGFTELTQSGKIINNSVFEPFVIFTIVGAVYFALCFPLSHLSRALERRLISRGA